MTIPENHSEYRVDTRSLKYPNKIFSSLDYNGDVKAYIAATAYALKITAKIERHGIKIWHTDIFNGKSYLRRDYTF